jgi:hypothetical protein
LMFRDLDVPITSSASTSIRNSTNCAVRVILHKFLGHWYLVYCCRYRWPNHYFCKMYMSAAVCSSVCVSAVSSCLCSLFVIMFVLIRIQGRAQVLRHGSRSGCAVAIYLLCNRNMGTRFAAEIYSPFCCQ